MGVSGDGGRVSILGHRDVFVLRRDSRDPVCASAGSTHPMPRWVHSGFVKFAHCRAVHMVCGFRIFFIMRKEGYEVEDNVTICLRISSLSMQCVVRGL